MASEENTAKFSPAGITPTPEQTERSTQKSAERARTARSGSADDEPWSVPTPGVRADRNIKIESAVCILPDRTRRARAGEHGVFVGPIPPIRLPPYSGVSGAAGTCDERRPSMAAVEASGPTGTAQALQASRGEHSTASGHPEPGQSGVGL